MAMAVTGGVQDTLGSLKKCGRSGMTLVGVEFRTEPLLFHRI